MWLESLELDVDSLSSTYLRVRVMKVVGGSLCPDTCWEVVSVVWEGVRGESIQRWSLRHWWISLCLWNLERD